MAKYLRYLILEPEAESVDLFRADEFSTAMLATLFETQLTKVDCGGIAKLVVKLVSRPRATPVEGFSMSR